MKPSSIGVARVLSLLVLFTAGCRERSTRTSGRLKIGLMPKLVGIPYFNACEKGAREAAAELDIDLTFDGPTTNDVVKQNALIQTWMARGFDVIAIAPNDPNAVVDKLRKARERGIGVLTWDADAAKDARQFFVNQATYEDIAKTLVDVMVESIGPTGRYIILTGSLTAANQNIWMDRMEKYRQAKYPQLANLLPGKPIATEENQALATRRTIDALQAYKDLEGIFALTSVAMPGAAEALRQERAAERVFLTGLSQPNTMRPYVKDGTVRKFVLWNPIDLGYLTVYTAKLLAEGKLKPGTIDAGRLGKITVRDDEVLLGPPLVFDRDNVDEYDF